MVFSMRGGNFTAIDILAPMVTKTTGQRLRGETVVGYYYDAMLNAHGFLYAGEN